MNSSISDSEARRWRRFLVRYAACTAGLAVMLAALLLVLDPFDTGHLTFLPNIGVPDFGQRLSFAGIARQPEVDTAIIGNSTIQLLDPERLSSMSGRKVVSLAIPGTGPVEQLVIADWFRRYHRGRGDIHFVFGLDTTWCTTADPIKLSNPFPFWLYSTSQLDYAFGAINYKMIEAAWRKVKLLAGHERKARPDGYHDYDTGHAWQEPDFPAVGADEAGAVPAQPGDFTAPPLLRKFLAKLDARVPVVLVFPPRHRSALPPPGSVAAERQDACKSAYREIAQSRPQTRVLDFLVDSAMVRNDENFFDQVHYRVEVAHAVEDRLVVALEP
jgi:hypothetical protein